MANPNIRLVDSDVISNLLIMSVRSDVSVSFMKPSYNFQLVTTQVVIQEVQTWINKIQQTNKIKDNAVNDNTVNEIKRSWVNIKGLFSVKEVKEDPSTFKNRGEHSLVDALPVKKENCKVVSNNEGDVIKFFKSRKLTKKYYQPPFEFYEEMEKFWFIDYKDMIRFIILSNHDFRVIQKKNLGNILTRVKIR
ncbi:MAG: hypothetical protein ACYCSA_04845 [Thermoplasmataceae archaeon]